MAKQRKDARGPANDLPAGPQAAKTKGMKANGAKAAGKGPKAARKEPKAARKGAKAAGKEPKAVKAGERYPLPDLGTLPDDIRERILAVQEKSGFVPDVFLKLARRPAEFRAFFAYYDALMLKDGPLTKAE